MRKLSRVPWHLLKRLKTFLTHLMSFWNTYYMLDVITALGTVMVPAWLELALS